MCQKRPVLERCLTVSSCTHRGCAVCRRWQVYAAGRHRGQNGKSEGNWWRAAQQHARDLSNAVGQCVVRRTGNRTTSRAQYAACLAQQLT